MNINSEKILGCLAAATESEVARVSPRTVAVPLESRVDMGRWGMWCDAMGVREGRRASGSVGESESESKSDNETGEKGE